MCGFVGIIGKDGAEVSAEIIRRSTQLIEHRGPDEEGFYFQRNVGFGFRRLSILDLSPTGHQPMHSDDDRFVIVFNGEIFNYIELRNELIGKGYQFRSTGDTEVLLNAFREWGHDCLHKLNGMWAFLIHDRKHDTLFGARDRFGIKPLFVYQNPQWLMLASEIKSIRDSGLYQGGQNWRTVARYFVEAELDDTEETFYEYITRIMPANAFTVSRDRKLRCWRYWSLPEESGDPEYDPVEEFESLFLDSVRLRIRSDVPVGVTLSGGLDSSSIICSMAELRAATPDGNIEPTLAFSFNDEVFDESRYLRDTVAQTGVELKSLSTNPMLMWDALPKMLWHHDEPAHSMTALVGYQLMKLARDNDVKVVLSGQGADETLAGYPSYFSNYRQSLINELQWAYLWNDLKEFTTQQEGTPLALVCSEGLQNLRNRLQRIAVYRNLAILRRKKRLMSNPWFSRELVDQIDLKDRGPLDLNLSSALKDSVNLRPLPLYLRIEDRNSMAASVEARLPFMDYRLVSLAFRLPARWKMKGPWNKYLLRQGLKNHIPSSVSERVDKFGFPTPVARWLRTTLAEPTMEVLTRQQARERGIYNHSNILADFERHRDGRINASARLFDVLQYEIWTDHRT